MAFVGGINIIDDRNDLNHGVTPEPRLDFAVALRGPVVAAGGADGARDVDACCLRTRLARRGHRAGQERRAGGPRPLVCCDACVSAPSPRTAART